MKLTNACFVLAVVFCLATANAQVTGLGTAGTVPLWKGTTSLGNSVIIQRGKNLGIGTKSPSTKLDVVGSNTSNAVITGSNTATTGTPYAVQGVAEAPSSHAVYGHATSTASGANAEGVFGQSDAPNGVGVNGVSTSTGIDGIGVTGSSLGTGVFGYTTATTGGSIGVLGSSGASGGGTGVYGLATSAGANAGVFNNQFGGNVLIGQNNYANVFRVDGTGKGYFDGGTQTGGADFAESVAVAKEFTQHEPGDLLIVDTTEKRQLKLSAEPYSTLVAGIYSTKPGVLATRHKMDEVVSNEIPLAIVGIVPCKVSAENGAIQPGDLLVTSATPGHAMKGTDRDRMLGAVVGKALEPLSEGNGVIQVLVTLQ